jgi:hypothetical protein
MSSIEDAIKANVDYSLEFDLAKSGRLKEVTEAELRRVA